jgi:hypothetical protein
VHGSAPLRRRTGHAVIGMPVFVAAYLSGAAAVALWIDFRFPNLRPHSWGRMGIVIAASFAADDLCGAVAGAGPQLLTVMGVDFLAIAATLLVCVWMLRMARASMPT